MNILQRQSYNTYLNAIGNLAVTDGNFIVGNGTTWVAESGNTARTSLGLGTGDSPTFTGLTINGASGNTLVVDTNTLVVDATNGRAGIGTTGPGEKLHVYDGKAKFEIIDEASIYEVLQLVNSTNYSTNRGVKMGFYVPTTPSSNRLGAEIGADNEAVDDTYLFFSTELNNTVEERMRIDSVGNVGINQTSPGAQLHVVSSAAGTHIAVFEAAATPSANLIEVNSNGATGGDLLVVDKNGRVGIGTTGPDDMLTLYHTTSTGDNPRIHLTNANTGTTATDGMHIGIANANQLLIANRENSSLRLMTNSLDRINIQADGLVGINQTSPGAQLHVVAGAAGTVGLIVDTAASPSADNFKLNLNGSTRTIFSARDGVARMEALGYDNGAGIGTNILLHRNTNASTPAAGYVALEDKGGTVYYIHPDDSGILRIGTTVPIGSADTTNGVVGDQTSLLAAKDLLNNLPTPSDSLQHLVEAKDALRQFVYKADEQGQRKYGGQEFFGIVTDFAPRYGKDNGKALNEITLFGDIVNAISEIVSRIERLEAQVI